MKKGLLLAVASVILLMGCGAKSNEIKVGAIFAITGPAANLGAPEEKTARMLVDEINAKGGINGKKINLIVKDSGADSEKAFTFAKQLVEEEKVVAIIGPTTSGESLKIKNLMEENKTLLISCAAAVNIVNPIAKYVFKTPQKDSDAVRKIYGTMKQLKIKKIGVLSSNTGFGKAGKEQLEKLSKEFGIEIVISEGYDKTATDLTDVLNKLKSAKIDAVVNWSIEPAQSIVAKNMKQIGFNVPLFQSHGFGNIQYVKAAGEAAEGIIFPGGQLLVADQLPDSYKQKKLLIDYKKAYESKYNEPASAFGGYAYDAIVLLKAALEKAGSLDKEKIREAFENLKDIPSVTGIFNMSATDHSGLDESCFEMLTVKNGAFVLYK